MTLESYPTFLPDGSQIAYWHPRQGSFLNINAIRVSPTAGGEGKNLTPALDRDVYRAMLDAGRQGAAAGRARRQPLKGGAARRLNLGSVSPYWSFWVEVAVGAKGGVAFSGTDPGQPAELFYMASTGAAPKRLTDFNHAVKDLQLGKTQTLTWQCDGMTNNGELTYPANYVAGKTYPLVPAIHGGPYMASTATLSSLSQLFAGRGYFVFEPNYRGSGNLGNACKTAIHAIYKDAGAGPGRDVMAGLARLKRSGLIDTTRIGVSGWSYSGYMTTWLPGHYPTQWKAAGAAVTDLLDQYNLADASVQWAAFFDESFWLSEANAQAYREQSPMSAASRIRTPTLIPANPRVPVTQSYKLFHALKDNGVTTDIAWPVAAHNASDPVRQRERNRFWLEWMDAYLQPGAGAPAPTGSNQAATCMVPEYGGPGLDERY